MRRVLSTIAFGVHRVRADGARSALVAAGVAAAGLLLAAVLLGSLVAQERALADSVDALAPPVSTVRAAWFGVPGQGDVYEDLDSRSRSAIGSVTSGKPTATVLFRESSVEGRYVSLGAVDGLAPWVRVTSGRLPSTCTRGLCEVLQLRGRGAPPRGFVVVGRGVLRSTALFGDAVPAERNQLDRARLAPRLQRVVRYHQPAPPPLLLAEGVRGLASRDVLAATYRSYGWVTRLRGADARPWLIDDLVVSAARARTELQGRSVGYDLVAPAEELRSARERTEIGARRLLLLGGQGAALLLGFAAFAATRLRRPSQASDRRLTLLGVPMWQRGLVVTTQAVLLTIVGVALAWLAATLAAAAIGEGELARHALLAPSGVLAMALLGLASTVAVVCALVANADEPGRFGALDVIAAGLALAVAAALVRGAADTEEVLRGGGSGALLIALPVAVVAIVGIVAARVLPRLVLLVARALPDRRLTARLALLSIARRPGAGATAVAFLVVSIGLAVFAGTYRATLEQGRRDQAAFALGADLVLREDLSRLVPVREVATPERLQRLGPRVVAAPVLRATGNVAGLSDVTGVAVLGVEPALLRTLRGSDLELPNLAVAADLVGPRLRDTLPLRARSSIPGVSVEAALRLKDGSFERVLLGTPLPARARGSTLLGLRIVPPPRLQERGADAGVPAVGTIELGTLPGVDYSTWVGVGGATFRDGRLDVTLSGQVDTWFRPRQALDGRALPAVVSSSLADLADENGRLVLQVGGRPVALRVVRTAERFPSTRGDFAIADRAGLEAALNLADPGSGFPTEVWANAADAEAERAARSTLRRAPFDSLVLDSRVEREQALRDDPISSGSLAMLAIAAAAAFLLALFALALTTLADLRDDRDALLDLESQGASPGTLRRVVRIRQLVVGLAGLVGGVVAGAILAGIVTDVVAVSASGTSPVPPLEASTDPGLVLAGLVLLGLVGAAIVVSATRSAFREGEAGRPKEADA
jgi:hypothetical protein